MINRGRFQNGQHWRPRKPWWDREWLVGQYAGLGKSAGDIADEWHVNRNTILFWLEKHGIACRSVSEARARKHWGVSGADNPMWGRFGDLNPRWSGGSAPERQAFYASQVGGDPARADGGSRERDPTGAGGNQLAVKRIQTDEWRPSCRCVAHDPVPCLVLDPFTGSGTTGAVSLRLGRNFVGCELNPEYAEFASRRIRGDAPIPASAPSFSDTEDSVFDMFNGTL